MTKYEDCDGDCDSCHLDEGECEDCLKATAEDVKAESDKPPMMVGLTLNMSEIQTDVAAILCKSLDRSMRELVKQEVRRHVADTVNKHVDEVALEHIRPAIEKVMSDGWYKTDYYGNPSGDKITLRKRIETFLTEEYKNGYGDKAGPRIEKFVAEHVTQALKNDLSEQIEKARLSFREMVEEQIRQVLTKQLKETVEYTVRSSLAEMLSNVLVK